MCSCALLFQSGGLYPFIAGAHGDIPSKVCTLPPARGSIGPHDRGIRGLSEGQGWPRLALGCWSSTVPWTQPEHGLKIWGLGREREAKGGVEKRGNEHHSWHPHLSTEGYIIALFHHQIFISNPQVSSQKWILLPKCRLCTQQVLHTALPAHWETLGLFLSGAGPNRNTSQAAGQGGLKLDHAQATREWQIAVVGLLCITQHWRHNPKQGALLCT